MPDDRLLHPKAGHSQKVSLLTDLEYRVWTQYLLSADDFGVMRGGPAKVKADNYHLEHRPSKAIQRCLDVLVTRGLIRTFTDQGKPYLYSHNWQTYQKVEYPRATSSPKPPADALEVCDAPTRLLFDKHPGGLRRARPEGAPNVSQPKAEDVPTMRAQPRETANAHGERLEANANGQRLAFPDFPGDVWFEELKAAYPPSAVSSGHLTQQAFVAAVISQGTPLATFTVMLMNLDTQKRGHQWRVKNMIPRLDKWLREGLWEQRHEETPVSTLVNDKSARTLSSGEQFVRGGR